MANEITFKIRIDGSDSVKEITLDSKELAQAFSQVQTEVKGLKANMVSLASTIGAIDGVTNALNQLNGMMTSLTSAYSVQESAETRLAQAIRLSEGKHLMSYDVQATCVTALLEDYIRRAPCNLTFQVRRNYTVAIRCVLPSSQVLSVPISFKRVLEGGFSEDFEKGLKSLMDFSSNFGKITIR